jgi:hypothetical protein
MNSIIERIKEIGLDFDHHEHNILYNASKDISDVSGIVCEVGLRRGGGLGVILTGCIETNNHINRPFIAIDPYGDIIYSAMEGSKARLGYTNDMKYETMISLYSFAKEHNILIDLFCMEDTVFFEKFSDGIPVYNIDKKMYNDYALVHLDGPHFLSEVEAEVDFFMSRISIGGYIVLDDVTYYDISVIENKLTKDGQFKLIENDGKKASYKRVV